MKVREAQLQKVPYLLVLGSKEAEEGLISPRKLGGTNIPSMKIEEFLVHIEKANSAYTWREVEANSENT